MNDYFRHAIYTKKNPLVLYLQSDASDICDNIQFLLGAFETATGEQV